MKHYFWKYGFVLRFKRFNLSVLGPRDIPLFSEREGIRSPVLKVWKFRLFIHSQREALRQKENRKNYRSKLQAVIHTTR